MDLYIQNIISKDATALERVEDYHNLIRVLQEEKDLSINFMKNADSILKTLKEDIQNEDVKVSQDSLHFLGVFLHQETLLCTLDCNILREILDGLCTLIQSSSEKIVCTRALWCLSKQKIPMNICLEKIDAILQALEHSSENFKQSSASVELEAIRVLNRFLNELPDNLAVRSEKWARKLYLATVHPSGKVREGALQTLNLARPCFEKHQAELLYKLIPDLKEVLVPGMLKLFKEKQELHALKLWNLFLDILGKTLHQGASLINNLLAVVEKAFKSSATDVKLAAFKSWQHLISNFGSELDVLANPKRLRLVMQPLKANNARAESIAMVKFTVWWHLANSLGPKLSANLEMVIYPLMQFCFGITESVSNSQISNANGVSTNTTPKLNVNNSSLNMSPGICHSFPTVHRYGCEALAQILGYGMTVPITRPPFTIGMLSHPVISPPSVFLRHSRILILAVKEAIANLSSEKKDLHLQLYLWHSLIALIRTAAETENIKDLSEVVSTFLNVIEEFVKSNTFSRDVALKLLEAAVQLPSRMLASSALSVSEASVMHGTPALFLVNMLFHGNILKLSISQERFMGVFQKLITVGLNATSEPLRFIQSVVKILDSSTEDIDHSDTIFRLWSTIVFPLLEHVQKTQEINQGDALEHDFSCMYGILLFPIQHLLMKPLLQNSLKTLIRTWGDVYRSFASCSALVVNTEGNIGLEEFSASVLNITTGANFEDPLFLDNLSQLLMIMVTTIDFTPASLINNNNPSAAVSPSAWMKRKQKPLGNLTAFISLLEKSLFAVEKVQTRTISLESSDIPQQNKSNYFKISSTLMDVLRHLYSHTTSSILIVATTAKLASALAMLFSDPSDKDISKIHQGQMMTKLETVWNTITNCFQLHCNGPYDSDLLTSICPLLEATLLYPKKNIRVKTRMFWHSTFAQSSDNLNFPESFKIVLRKIRPSLVPGFTGDNDAVMDELSGNNSQENELISDQSIDKIPSPQKFSSPFRNKTIDESISAKKKNESPSSVTGMVRRRERVEDLDDIEFVKIAPDPKKRRILTEHQKEMMTAKKDVPALYNDLSQDTNRISSQFIDGESQELTVAEKSEVQDAIIKRSDNDDINTEKNIENVGIVSEENAAVESEIVVIDSQQTTDESVVITEDSCKIDLENETTSDVNMENSVVLIEIENQTPEVIVVSLTQENSSLTSQPSTQEISDQENQEISDSVESNTMSEKELKTSNDTNACTEIADVNKSMFSDEPKESETNTNDIKETITVTSISNEAKKSAKQEKVDEKLYSQPILEIKKLTEKEILNLSPHSAFEMNENKVEQNKHHTEGSHEESSLSESEKLTPKSFVKYISRKKNSVGSTGSSPVTRASSVHENDDVIPSSQDVNFHTVTEDTEITETVSSDKESKAEQAEEINKNQPTLVHESRQVLTHETSTLTRKSLRTPASIVKRKRKHVSSSSEGLKSELDHKTGKSRHMRRQLRDLKESPNYALTRKKKKPDTHVKCSKKPNTVSKENKNDDNLETGTSEKNKKNNSPQVTSSKSPNNDNKHAIQFISDSDGNSSVLLIHTSSPKSERKITRKSKTARKSLPASLSGSSSGETSLVGRGKRQVKKSLKALLAEETSNVLGRKMRQSTDNQKNKIMRYLKKKEKSANSSSSGKSDTDKSESDSLESSQNTMFESLEIDNLQIPSSGIEMLVKSPILNAAEPKIESVPLIVGDTVEITSRPEGDNAADNEISVFSEMAPINPDENSNEKNDTVDRDKPDTVSDSQEESKETTDKSEVVAVLFDSKSNLDHDSDSSMETDACITFSSLNETVVENVENGQMIPSPSCPDVYSVEGISIPVTEDVEVTIGEQESIDLGATSVLVTDDYSEKEQVIYVLSEMPESGLGNEDPQADNIIVNTEVEVETLKENADAKLVVSIENSSYNTESSSASDSSPTKKSKTRIKNAKSNLSNSEKSLSASPKGRRGKKGDKKLMDLLHRPEDESLTFIAQRNTKTYSRDNVVRTQSKQLIPKQGSDPLLSIKQKSPLMQRVTSRAVRMLEAAAKKNLNTYEKMKYEQRRSPDRPESEEKPREDYYPVPSSPPAAEETSESSNSDGFKHLSKLPEHLLVSPSTSPSSGILKKRKNEGMTSASPSPTYRRRVSFADPLVQDKDEISHSEWVEKSPLAQRSLELNKIDENVEGEEMETITSTKLAEPASNINGENEDIKAEYILSSEIGDKKDLLHSSGGKLDEVIDSGKIITPVAEKTDLLGSVCEKAGIIESVCEKAGIIESVCEKAGIIKSVCEKAGIIESVCEKAGIIESVCETSDTEPIVDCSKLITAEATVEKEETSEGMEWIADSVKPPNEVLAITEISAEKTGEVENTEKLHDSEIKEKTDAVEIVNDNSNIMDIVSENLEILVCAVEKSNLIEDVSEDKTLIQTVSEQSNVPDSSLQDSNLESEKSNELEPTRESSKGVLNFQNEYAETEEKMDVSTPDEKIDVTPSAEDGTEFKMESPKEKTDEIIENEKAVETVYDNKMYTNERLEIVNVEECLISSVNERSISEDIPDSSIKCEMDNLISHENSEITIDPTREQPSPVENNELIKIVVEVPKAAVVQAPLIPENEAEVIEDANRILNVKATDSEHENNKLLNTSEEQCMESDKTSIVEMETVHTPVLDKISAEVVEVIEHLKTSVVSSCSSDENCWVIDSPSRKRNISSFVSAASQTQISSMSTYTVFSSDGVCPESSYEPKRKKIKLDADDIAELANELHSNCTAETLRCMSPSRMLHLQKQLLEMTLAISSALLSPSAETNPE